MRRARDCAVVTRLRAVLVPPRSGSFERHGAGQPSQCRAPVSAELQSRTYGARRPIHASAEAPFTEERESGLLSEKLQLEGTLIWRAPDYLEKLVLKPRPERFVVDGGQLTIDYGQRKPREIRLDDYAPLRAMVEAFRAAFGGDRITLERYFRLSLAGDAHNWRLRLEPRDPRLAERVAALVLGGRNAQLLTIETLERNGDRALMRLLAPDPLAQ